MSEDADKPVHDDDSSTESENTQSGLRLFSEMKLNEESSKHSSDSNKGLPTPPEEPSEKDNEGHPTPSKEPSGVDEKMDEGFTTPPEEPSEEDDKGFLTAPEEPSEGDEEMDEGSTTPPEEPSEEMDEGLTTSGDEPSEEDDEVSLPGDYLAFLKVMADVIDFADKSKTTLATIIDNVEKRSPGELALDDKVHVREVARYIAKHKLAVSGCNNRITFSVFDDKCDNLCMNEIAMIEHDAVVKTKPSLTATLLPLTYKTLDEYFDKCTKSEIKEMADEAYEFMMEQPAGTKTMAAVLKHFWPIFRQRHPKRYTRNSHNELAKALHEVREKHMKEKQLVKQRKKANDQVREKMKLMQYVRDEYPRWEKVLLTNQTVRKRYLKKYVTIKAAAEALAEEGYYWEQLNGSGLMGARRNIRNGLWDIKFRGKDKVTVILRRIEPHIIMQISEDVYDEKNSFNTDDEDFFFEVHRYDLDAYQHKMTFSKVLALRDDAGEFLDEYKITDVNGFYFTIKDEYVRGRFHLLPNEALDEAAKSHDVYELGEGATNPSQMDVVVNSGQELFSPNSTNGVHELVQVDGYNCLIDCSCMYLNIVGETRATQKLLLDSRLWKKDSTSQLKLVKWLVKETDCFKGHLFVKLNKAKYSQLLPGGSYEPMLFEHTFPVIVGMRGRRHAVLFADGWIYDSNNHKPVPLTPEALCAMGWQGPTWVYALVSKQEAKSHFNIK